MCEAGQLGERNGPRSGMETNRVGLLLLLFQEQKYKKDMILSTFKDAGIMLSFTKVQTTVYYMERFLMAMCAVHTR